MEVRGGSGYIEEWVHPRIIRDSLLGSVWEGTSNIVALDVVRAVRREGADAHLERALRAKLDQAQGVPPALRARIGDALDGALAFVRRLAADKTRELHTRQAASALYNATTAALLAWEGDRLAAGGGDARRTLAAALVCKTRLEPADPLAEDDPAWEARVARAMFDEAPLPPAQAQALLEPTR
jgi:hypothetical protein